jgi:hypothetical protein
MTSDPANALQPRSNLLAAASSQAKELLDVAQPPQDVLNGTRAGFYPLWAAGLDGAGQVCARAQCKAPWHPGLARRDASGVQTCKLMYVQQESRASWP